MPGAGLGDHACFAHLFGEQALSQTVVELVGAGVVEILALEIDLGAAQVLCHFFGVIQAAGSAGVFAQQRIQLGDKRGVVLVALIRLFKLAYGIHQRFGHKLSAVNTKSSF